MINQQVKMSLVQGFSKVHQIIDDQIIDDQIINDQIIDDQINTLVVPNSPL